jgi:hypothetical protein
MKSTTYIILKIQFSQKAQEIHFWDTVWDTVLIHCFLQGEDYCEQESFRHKPHDREPLWANL